MANDQQDVCLKVLESAISLVENTVDNVSVLLVACYI